MILIVKRRSDTNATRLTYPLRVWGIPYAVAYTGSDLNDALQTPAGAFAPNSNDLRNYFRNFDAVFVAEEVPLNNNGIRSAHHWLQWNNADDTPIVYFGWNFAGDRDVPLPSNFPLVAPSLTDISVGIASRVQPATAVVVDNFAAVWDMYFARMGTAVRLLREQVELLTPTYSWRVSGGQVGAWRLKSGTHATLAEQPYTHSVALNGRAGEILATPAAQPDENYPDDAVYAYRYYNRLLLPQVRLMEVVHESEHPDLFWLLYALKLVGVRPARQLPVYWETDHPIQLTDGGSPMMPFETMLTLQRDTWAWLRDFCRQTGMACHNGVQTGGMARARTSGGFHWNLVHATRFGLSAALETVARQAHEILLAGHREGTLPCGIHDHTLANTRGFWGATVYNDFRRHSASDYAESAYDPGGLSFPRQAPNNVLLRRGRCCVRTTVAPAAAVGTDATTQQLGDTEYYEWDYAGGSFTDAAAEFTSVRAGDLHAARLVVESNVAELRALGFPDGHGGEHGYTNCAANNSGGDYYWQACREYGYKALRSAYHCNANNGTARNKAMAPNGIWHGLHLIRPRELEWMAVGSRGLFAPGNSANAVAVWGLDIGSDISADWPNTAYRAHRRAMSFMMALWSAALVYLQAPYVHPVNFWAGASPSEPVARFAGASLLNWFGQPHWNPQVELLENLRLVVSVLSDYLKFGSVSDLIWVRERVMEEGTAVGNTGRHS